MPEETKSRYTEAQKKAVAKYLSESVDTIRVRVPKGQKEAAKAAADARGMSLNAFCVEAISTAVGLVSERSGPES